MLDFSAVMFNPQPEPPAVPVDFTASQRPPQPIALLLPAVQA